MNKEQFLEALNNDNISYDDEKLEKLYKYYELLIEENEKYNLTNITEIEDVYLKHFYDSLTISKIVKLNNQKLCDIGTGAGFPGIVLKIMYPNLKITLVESMQKRCNFLNMIIQKLNLKDTNVVNERAEIYSKKVREKFDIVTSRAVAPLKHLLEFSIPLVRVDGFYVAMKANIKEEELTNIENYYEKLKITKVEEIKFKLPFENSARTLIKYTKNDITNKKYPRKYSEIKKKDM